MQCLIPETIHFTQDETIKDEEIINIKGAIDTNWRTTDSSI